VFSQIGPLEIVLVIVVLLIVFGPKRLPSLGRSLGTGMREFKDSITGDDKQRGETDATGRPALSQAQADVPQPPTAGATHAGESAPEQRA
jgi:sec-independent protein translocase protein TatA